jgi:hypothetical protein
MALRRSFDGLSCRSLDPQLIEQLLLLGCECCEPFDLAVTEGDAVILDALGQSNRPRPGQCGAGLLEAQAHHPVQYQGEETEEGMGADALGQAMVDGAMRSLI